MVGTIAMPPSPGITSTSDQRIMLDLQRRGRSDRRLDLAALLHDNDLKAGLLMNGERG